MTRSKNDFVPIDPEGKEVKWYSCGPTVYDDAHLGHARNYVTNDILRRILAHYYGYKLKFVQNITDVDDKIILRGRQQYLLGKFKADNPTVTEEVINTTIKAFDAYVKKNLPLLNPDVTIGSFNSDSAEKYANVIQGKSVDGVGPPGDKEAKIKMHLRTASTAVTSLLAPSKTTPEDIEIFYAGAEDVLLPYLDSLYGSTIDASDHSVFTTLTKKYEARFNEDMRALNVLDPDVVTRVTEYGDDIVAFVDKIIKNGMASAHRMDLSTSILRVSRRERATTTHALNHGTGVTRTCKQMAKVPCQQSRHLKSATTLTLLYGSLLNRESQRGRAHGVLVDQDGISSAPSWLQPYWANRWTSTVEVLIFAFPITITSLHSQRPTGKKTAVPSG